jgi:SAM-dependent methyltransferase
LDRRDLSRDPTQESTKPLTPASSFVNWPNRTGASCNGASVRLAAHRTPGLSLDWCSRPSKAGPSFEGARPAKCHTRTVPDEPAYVLGDSAGELRRLESQAAVMNPVTRRFMVEAEVGLGMRVLDVGSGAGDVAMLAADLVGPDGEVVGFDQSAAAIGVARERAAARSLTTVRFLADSIDTLNVDGLFDAAIGRYVLQFQPDPAAMLAAVAARVRPGGLILFHELDWSGVSSDPSTPTYERLSGWLQRAIEASGASVHMGLALPSVFAKAGLRDPELRLEQRLGVGVGAGEVLNRMAQLAETLAPKLAEMGISPDQLDLGTLKERLQSEVLANHSLVRSHLQVGAWTRA